MRDAGAARKVLLVDDSSLSRRALRTILEQAGYQPIEAADGLAAIERYSIERPDLVLLDLIMPGLAGIEVLGKILEIDPRARVIVASADIQTTTRDQARALGAIDYMAKPFERDMVLATVARALENNTDAPQ